MTKAPSYTKKDKQLLKELKKILDAQPADRKFQELRDRLLRKRPQPTAKSA